MPLPDQIRKWVAEHNEDALLADGFEDAILGVAVRCSKPALVVYDIEKCVEILMRGDDGMDYDEAMEFLEFNTLGAWAGEGTPLFLWRYEEGME
jgi:hypothetical protein